MPNPAQLAAVFFFAAALSGQGPAGVLLIVNRNAPESLRIGEYYARRRAIPASNVCRIAAAREEEISREEYEKEIAAPVRAFLRSRRLSERILYMVTTLGVPLKIRGQGGRNGDAASVDSELTTLYQELRGKRVSRDGPIENPFFGHRQEAFAHPRFPLYLATRLAAYSVEDVKRMIDRSLEAVNRGRVVLDLSADDEAPGNAWLRDAAIRLPKDRVILDASPRVLERVQDVIGYASWGSNDPHRKNRFLAFGWLPGAIATEYVSTNGRTFARPPAQWTTGPWQNKDRFFAGSPQGLTADLIQEGASGASGHVYEPFLGLTPRPQELLPAYLAGRNLAESYYLAIPALSWQNIVVGDPLCALALAR
ncbi:MAG: TIGR03790 family protein [Acidobacteria bacterium]|nr:TIGR03790 family protein [Acidobacteriota bacterium]